MKLLAIKNVPVRLRLLPQTGQAACAGRMFHLARPIWRQGEPDGSCQHPPTCQGKIWLSPVEAKTPCPTSGNRAV